jgi:uncharacterized membrane protein (DUF485 family)
MSQPTVTKNAVDDSIHSREFHALAARKNAVSLALTLAIMAVYYGFIFLIAFRKDLVGAKISAHVTWGIPMGIGVILLSWVATGIYVGWANSKYDGMAEELRGKWGK